MGRVGAWIVCLGLAAGLAAGLEGAERADEGPLVADHVFPDLHGDDGRRSLAELRGRPVLFATWTQGTGEGALSAAASILERHGPAVIVVLSGGGMQGTDAWAAARAYLQDRYGITRAWTCASTLPPVTFEGPNESGRVAVIGADGRLKLAGVARAVGGRPAELVAAEVQRLKQGWGSDPAVRRARATAFGKGLVGEARAALAAAAAGPERDEAIAEVERDHDQRRAAVLTQRARGRMTEARAAAVELQRACAGHEAWAKDATELLATFDEPGAKAELEACHELERLAKPVRAGKVPAALPGALEAFAAKHDASPVAAYARELAALARAWVAR